ncbi:glycosyltransferase family 32 protein [Dellaglioa carnosa]|uniref:Glycosyl transferase n=1 Tax=Dellaglioa carnosa TaxID=2995136 RepID=A0ABT4JMK1_9LACO|nr:glycosyltransferase [Dellaglioa carnosa]MCZ2491591.1 glycosyl transferase [Dellaglioa carnosa]MCZ2494668.1 glycosyl transferase [Dellaglioa carnosa]MDK1731531.1 glycosyl transferase [Dellaglioa carnosa]
MIPKKIHYCWFGGEKSETVKNFIDMNKKLLFDYEFYEWNETNVPFGNMKNRYLSEALKYKEWAFVSDYVRLWVLKKYGGIYIDTDVLFVKKPDELLNSASIIGFENRYTLSTALIGSEVDSIFINEALYQYDNASFIINGRIDKTPNVVRMTELGRHNGLVYKNKSQKLKNNLIVYPIDYFSPIHFISRKESKTVNTRAIHFFDASWTKENSKKRILKKLIYYIFRDYYFIIIRYVRRVLHG